MKKSKIMIFRPAYPQTWHGVQIKLIWGRISSFWGKIFQFLGQDFLLVIFSGQASVIH